MARFDPEPTDDAFPEHGGFGADASCEHRVSTQGILSPGASDRERNESERGGDEDCRGEGGPPSRRNGPNQRSPLTSKRGEGADPSGARHGSLRWSLLQNTKARSGKPNCSLAALCKLAVSRRPVSRMTRRRISLAVLRGRSPEGSRCRADAELSASSSTMKSNERPRWRSTSWSLSGQRLYSRATWLARCQLVVSVRCTIPRKSRRLVRTLKIVGAMIRSRWASAGVWSRRITS